MNELSWLLAALAFVSAFTVGKWCRVLCLELALLVDEWAGTRAYLLCGRAIVDYEYGRGKHIVDALRYSIAIMHGGGGA